MTDKNGDDDKQDKLQRHVFLSFTHRVELTTKKVALVNLLLQKEIENQVKLTREEHEKLTAKIREIQEGLDVTEHIAPPPLPKRTSPPASAALLLAFIAPKNSAQALLGDLEEMFQKNADKFGEDRARRMYWLEAARSVGPIVWQWVKRMGFITLLVEYVRRKFNL